MNYVSLLGRLTKDPELKYTQSGKAFCRFSLAVKREFSKDEADFINCVAWDKRAEAIAEYLRKGKRALVQGRIQTGSYERDGQKVYTTDIVVDKFDFVDSLNGGQGSQDRLVNTSYDDADTMEDDDDDDFPF